MMVVKPVSHPVGRTNRVFENKMLKRREKWHNREFRNNCIIRNFIKLYFSPNIISWLNQAEWDVWGMGKMRNSLKLLIRKPLGKSQHEVFAMDRRKYWNGS